MGPASGGHPIFSGGGHNQILQLGMFAGSCALVLGAGLLISSFLSSGELKSRAGIGAVLLIGGGIAVCCGLYG